ncbi:hypothetical protein ACFX43_11865 [Nocardioides sp. YIM B13467]|uniref:hypothetical protein n=1 Tax=Nocardioides sp. YIM B13467 TaxID=3366294 RepID=UPI003671B0EA
MPALLRKFTAGVVFAALATVVGVVVATPAQAASHYGCSYPNLCLKTGTYSGGTTIWYGSASGYRNLPEGDQNRADSVINTKNDDSIWLLDTGTSPDSYICIPADTYVNLGNYSNTLRGPNETWANDADTVMIWPDSDNGMCRNPQGVDTNRVQQGAVPNGWRP